MTVCEVSGSFHGDWPHLSHRKYLVVGGTSIISAEFNECLQNIHRHNCGGGHCCNCCCPPLGSKPSLGHGYRVPSFVPVLEKLMGCDSPNIKTKEYFVNGVYSRDHRPIGNVGLGR